MATVPFEDTAAAGQARKPAHVAYACAAMGWAAFPLAPGTKRPAITGWQQRATTSLEALAYMWSGEFQDCSVGIATGEKSDLFVIDVDKKPDVDGFASLRTLLLEHDAPASIFANTITVATPRGGCHIYMKWSHGVVNSAGELGDGIDVRGAGGLVHAPGLDSYQIVPRDGVRRLDVMEAPDWLVELCRKQPKRPVNADGSENDPNGGPGVLGKERTLDLLGAAPPGTRNDELNRAAFRLGLRGELSEAEAWAECRLVLVSIGANDDERAQRRTFESGWNDGIAKRG
jgi:hypothetical protein